MEIANPVIKWLHLLEAICGAYPFNSLDAEDRLLFCDLIIRWSRDDKVWVRDLLRDRRHPSPTTAYRRLMRLQGKGLVSFQVPKEDRRLRCVLPTEAALRHISGLEVALYRFVSDRTHGAQDF